MAIIIVPISFHKMTSQSLPCFSVLLSLARLCSVYFTCEEDNIIIPLPHMRRLRHREGRSLVLDTELGGNLLFPPDLSPPEMVPQ